MCRANEQTHAARGGAAVRRPRFRDGARHGARRRIRRATRSACIYGQRHRAELAAAARVAAALGAREHRVMQRGSRRHRRLGVDRREHRGARIAERRHSGHLCAGAQHPDAGARAGLGGGSRRRGYFRRRECRRLLGVSGLPAANSSRLSRSSRSSPPKPASKAARFKIHAPLISMSQGGDHPHGGSSSGVDYAMTVSCYQASAEGLACGRCDSCRLRAAGFRGGGGAGPDALRMSPRQVATAEPDRAVPQPASHARRESSAIMRRSLGR